MRVILSFILIILTLPVFAQNSVLRQGNKAYDEGKYGQAFELYEKAAAKTPQKAAYNSGTALYRLQDYGAAAQAFEQALKEPGNKRQAAFNQNVLYNFANSAYKAGDKESAKQAMRAVILNNLKDNDAKQNLQFMLKEEKAQNQCNNPKENPQQNKDNQKDKQNQNQDKQNQENKQDKQKEKQKQEQQEKEAAAKEEAASVLQMASEHKQDLPKVDARSNQIEKDW
ncbi:MAG: hypothetical protein J6S61_03395 [Elusimicrobiaceae bacterium]|nr:hypothetical protein [Elusimicrobiaceae bacterium]